MIESMEGRVGRQPALGFRVISKAEHVAQVSDRSPHVDSEPVRVACVQVELRVVQGEDEGTLVHV